MATKQQIIEVVAHEAGLSKSAAERAVNATFDYIKGAVKSGDDVSIKGFATFKLKQSKERMGRNPKTGDAIVIPAKTSPKAAFSKSF
jgi:DNA-binding protein HU-beta